MVSRNDAQSQGSMRSPLEGARLVNSPPRPLQLVYYEACRQRAEALRRERDLKSGRGKRYLRQRFGVELIAISRDKLERH